MLPQLPAMFRLHVATMERLANVDPVRARAAVRQALESASIVLKPAEHGRHVVAHFGLAPVAVATGAWQKCGSGARLESFRRVIPLL